MKAIESLGFVSLKDYKEYVLFHVLKGKYYRWKKYGISIGVVVLCVALLVAGYFLENKTLFMGAGAIALCSFMFIYTLNVNVKNACNGKAKTVRAKQQTRFGKNGFVFELLLDNEEENERDEIFFDELEKVYDAPNAIYFYIEKRSVIIIPKRNLKISPAEAREFLQKFIPEEKLVICI